MNKSCGRLNPEPAVPSHAAKGLKVAPPFLFASGLDGALLPNTGKASEKGCLGRTCNMLARLHSYGIPITYLTEGSLAKAQASVAQFGMPAPDYWVCNGGTEIRRGDGSHDSLWLHWLGPALDPAGLISLLGEVDGLISLDQHLVGPHRMSFKLTGKLSEVWLARAGRLIAGYRNGLRLETTFDAVSGLSRVDVLPEAAGKLAALDFLAQRHTLPRSKVFFADDGGLELTQGEMLSVLVGNRSLETPWQRPKQGESKESAIYLARDFFGDGVLEGLLHFRLWPLVSQ